MKKAKLPDPAVTAKRIVDETIKRHEEQLPPGLEAAWKAWAKGIQKVDERGMTLLRAAFFAGAEAGQRMMS